MSKNVRLLEEGATDLEALLLRAGRDDAPPDPAARARMIENAKCASQAAILVGAGVVGARTLARGWSVLAKSFVAGTFVTATAGAVYVATLDKASVTVGNPTTATQSAPRQETTPTATATPSPSSEVRVVAPATPMASSKPAAPAAPVAPSAKEEPVPEDPPSGSVEVAAKAPATKLREETAQLSTVRRLLETSHASEALAALDDYDARFPRGVLAEEAAVLRVEALLAAGNGAGARRAVADFERRYPASSYGPRVQALTDEKE